MYTLLPTTATGMKHVLIFYGWLLLLLLSAVCSPGTMFALGSRFVDTTVMALPAVPDLSIGSVAFGDYDSDGFLDILLTGEDNSYKPRTLLYHNQGDGTFIDKTSALPKIQGVEYGSVAFGDYDNDGELDILITGASAVGGFTRLYHNQGNGTFVDIALPGGPDVDSSSVAFGDYDNDGFLDILLTGSPDGGSTALTLLYRNQGDGTFTNVTAHALAGVPALFHSSVAFGDYNNDGYLDLLLTGSSDGGVSGKTILYRNLRDGTFVDISTQALPAAIPGVEISSVAFGDYDSDGFLDILLTGSTGSLGETELFRNQGDGTFTNATAQALPTGVSRVSFSSVAFGDYDSDGRLDILLTGEDVSSGRTRLYRNQGNNTLFGLNPPSNLRASVSPSLKTLSASWDPPTQLGYSYNVRIVDGVSGSLLNSPMDIGSTRLLPGLGNANANTDYNLSLPSSSSGIYHVSVQTIAADYRSSQWNQVTSDSSRVFSTSWIYPILQFIWF
jgi:hypothetical protein